ncbi:AIR synthase related protein, partial [Novosphingobium sp.]|uniref:AIR synthase related protein n=1 Tax=Novosphingobium sp. TaxID=1874826 RepID=UPI0035671572
TDCSPRYCYADPYEGGKQAVAETYRNICAVGARPLAITNCLNFANPQRPEIMAQIVQALEGMGDACRALDYPIVSGNVSLYNESKATGGGSAILPTPAIGGVGLMLDHEIMTTIAFKNNGDAIWLVGGEGTHLGQSLYLREIAGREAGDAPKVDLAVERKNGELIRDWIGAGKLTAVHDISDGGLLVALTEMALASDVGCALTIELDTAKAFGEDQSRYIVTTAPNEMLEDAIRIGTVGGTQIAGVELTTLREANEAFFRDWMEA